LRVCVAGWSISNTRRPRRHRHSARAIEAGAEEDELASARFREADHLVVEG
jgi:hypothetical protein